VTYKFLKETENDMNKQVIKCYVDESASCYHRMIIPAKKLQGVVVDGKELDFQFIQIDNKDRFIPEESVQQNDVIWYLWNIKNKITQIARWKKEKNVKVLMDIDDYWQYSKKHPSYNNATKIKLVADNLIRLASEADIVTSSTVRIGMHLLPINQYTAFLGNFLEPIEGFEKTKSDKIRVGICGSISHYPDWLELKGAINRFAKNDLIASNYEFHICGYQKNAYWDEVVKLFKVKKNLNVVVKDLLPLESYLDHYKEIDVLLLPLEDIEFNYCKSSLKLSECLITNTIPVGSRIYSRKELGGICEADAPIEYERWLLYLLEEENRKAVLNHINTTNTKDNLYNERIEGLKEVFENLLTKDMSIKLDNIDIYGITYSPEQFTEFNKYDNSHVKTLEQKSYLFEWNVTIDIIDNKELKEYLGIFSWKFDLKTGFSQKFLNKVFLENKYNEYDFINLAHRQWSTTEEYLRFSYKQHPKLEDLLNKVLSFLKVNKVYNKHDYTYSNFFIMKSEYWKDYVENWVKPAIAFMEENQEYSQNANYVSGLPADKLKEYTGLDFYTYHTFVLERLILYYIANKQLKVLNIV